MRWKSPLLLFVAMLAFAPPSQSQSLIGSYLRCSTADETEADFIMNQVFAPIYDRHVEDGGLIGWGWVQHQSGGAWRRISTMTAEDTPTAWDRWGQIVQEIQDEHPNAWHRFNEICDSHDDYIWNLVSSSDEDPAATPDQWISTYWQCSEMSESRADELMEQITPVFDQHVEAGHIGGWAWYAHEIGGWFRRLLTVSADDDFNLIEGRAMLLEELQSDHGEVLEEFGSICSGHVDYIWANGRPAEEN